MEKGDNGLMRASVEWMSENYDRFNRELFDGKLGDCKFEIFTTGRGSQGRTLGRFRLMTRDVYVRRSSGIMCVRRYGLEEDINRSNFVELCNPCIMLNGHYSGTEDALQGTLVHEMVHYYTYMFGHCPKQAHGIEFREVAAVVSSRSGGRFTIQRLATAEEMSNYRLDDDMQSKHDRRVASKKARARAIFVYRKDGRVELTIVSNTNNDVPYEIYDYYVNGNGSGKADEIISSTDPDLIDELYNSGKRKLMRTWRFWNVENAPWIGNVKKYDFDTLFKSDNMDKGSGEVSEMKRLDIGRIVETVVNEYVSGLDGDDIRIGDMDLELVSPLENVN